MQIITHTFAAVWLSEKGGVAMVISIRAAFARRSRKSGSLCCPDFERLVFLLTRFFCF